VSGTTLPEPFRANLCQTLPTWAHKQGSQNRWEPDRTGSRWNRSGPVHEPVRFPPKNRAYKFTIPVNCPVFADSRKPLPGGFVNPAHKCSQLTLSSTTKISSPEVVARVRGGSVDESTTAGGTPCRTLEHEGAAGSGGAPYSASASSLPTADKDASRGEEEQPSGPTPNPGGGAPMAGTDRQGQTSGMGDRGGRETVRERGEINISYEREWALWVFHPLIHVTQPGEIVLPNVSLRVRLTRLWLKQL
jgi:hypothetical protein